MSQPAGPPNSLPGPPGGLPLGLHLSRTAKAVSQAFEAALAEVGGSVPVWLVLISLKTRQLRNQRELALAVGIREATLTHHLNAMDTSGLITRRRDPANRRIHVVEITPAGEAAFERLRETAVAFDHRLRTGIGSEERASFERVLDRLRGNATGGQPGGPAQAGLPMQEGRQR
jgi:MarR family transcriptional regulator, transcriptional regulator for hemolysin